MSSIKRLEQRFPIGLLSLGFICVLLSVLNVNLASERVFPLLLAGLLTLPLTALRKVFETRNSLWGAHLWKLSILVPITASPFLLQATNCVNCFSIFQTIEDCFKVKFGGKWIELYLSLELAFRLAIAMRHSPNQRDEWAMKVHHVLTITLLSGGIFYGFHGVSTLILVTHNISDIFLEACQIVRLRKNAQWMQAITFITLLISWILTRNLFYPMIIVYTFTTATYDFYSLSFRESPWEYQILALALLLLQILHLFWTASLFRVAINLYQKSQLQE